MKKSAARALALFFFCLSLPLSASATPFFVGVDAGTLGLGGEVGFHATNWLKFRLNVNYLPYDLSKKIDGVKYDLEYSNLTAGALVDLHPFMGYFSVSAGLYYRDMGIDLSATPHRSLEIGNNSYRPDQIGKLKADASWDRFAPYLGIGWGTGRGTETDISFDFSLGIMSLSGLKVDYRATGPIADPSSQSQADYEKYKRDMDREAGEVKDSLGRLKLFPVVSLGLSIKF
jgi:hypothetical protein